MIPGLKRELEAAVSEACLRVFGVEPPRLVLETPPKVELGDLACPVAFELAKVLKRPPRKIAEELAPALVLPDRRRRGGRRGRRLRELLPRPARASSRAMLARRRGGAGRGRSRREGHRRAHEHQPEQGRAHRAPAGTPSSATSSSEHVPAARPARRGPELPRRHRASRWPTSSSASSTPATSPSRRARAALGEEIREILDAFPDDAPGVRAAPARRPRLGPLRARRRRATRPTRRSRSGARPPSTPIEGARPAARDPPRRSGDGDARLPPRRGGRPLPPARRWSGSASPTTSCRARATSSRASFWAKAFELLKAAGATRARDGGQERRLLGDAARGRAGVRGDGGRRQGPRPLERHRHLHRQGRRLPALEARRPRDRLRVRGAPYVTPFGDAGVRRLATACRRSTGRGTTPTRRRPGRRGAASASGDAVINVIDVRQSYPQKVVKEAVRRAGLRRGGRPLGPLRLRDGRADPGRRRGARRRALRRGPRAGPSSRCPAARGSASRPTTSSTGSSRRRRSRSSRARAGRPGRARPRRGDRRRRPPRLHDPLLAEQGHRLRLRRRARLRGGHGALPAVRRRARREHLPEARGDRASRAASRPTRSTRSSALPASPSTTGSGTSSGPADARSRRSRRWPRRSRSRSSCGTRSPSPPAFHHLYHTHPIVQAKDDETPPGAARRAPARPVHLDDVLGVLGVPIPERM